MLFKIVGMKGSATFVVVAGIGDADPLPLMTQIVDKYMELRSKNPNIARDTLLYDVKDWLSYTGLLPDTAEMWWVDEKHVDIVMAPEA